MAKWHVLQASGYADTQADYVTVNGKAAVADELIDFGYLDNPDFIVSRGPRGGIKWQRA